MSIAHACLPQWIGSLHLHIQLSRWPHMHYSKTGMMMSLGQEDTPPLISVSGQLQLISGCLSHPGKKKIKLTVQIRLTQWCLVQLALDWSVFHDGTSNLKSTVTPTLHCSLSQPSLSTDTYVGMVAAVCMLYNYIISTGSVNSCIHVM